MVVLISASIFQCLPLNLQTILFFRFAEWVINMANLGFPRSKTQILEAVKLYLDKANMKIGAFTDNRPGISWFYGFSVTTPILK